MRADFRAPEPIRPDLDALAVRVPPAPLTRFAPSPTGYLHLGHVVNAIYTWGVARALGGRVLLRIEDHDRSRSRPEFERAIVDDLDWLGLEPDLGTTSTLRSGTSRYRQSNAEDDYRAAAASLASRGLVFACRCSRKTIAHTFSDETSASYPGTCRGLALSDGPGKGLRVRLDPRIETFDDALLGVLEQDPSAQCGDLLIRDRDRHWTYQFAVVVDDLRHGIDLVIRGRDLVDSTGRQMALARLLGRPRPPVFLHHPLVLNARGDKLSKSNRDTGVREMRAAGRAPEEVLGLAARACGLLPQAGPLAATDLPALFTRC
jgi:glutamyl-tRNA synthetase/glutamyl-Q tRNA(Asp) synthetase